MKKERLGLYKSLAESLRTSVIMNSEITDRVKIAENFLLSEKIIEWSVGKSSKERIDKLPQIHYTWVKF